MTTFYFLAMRSFFFILKRMSWELEIVPIYLSRRFRHGKKTWTKDILEKKKSWYVDIDFYKGGGFWKKSFAPFNPFFGKDGEKWDWIIIRPCSNHCYVKTNEDICLKSACHRLIKPPPNIILQEERDEWLSDVFIVGLFFHVRKGGICDVSLWQNSFSAGLNT